MPNQVVSMSATPEQSVAEPERIMQGETLASPSILGLYAFAVATFMVAGYMANWYGHSPAGLVLFPLVLIFGGIAQFYAGVWSFQTGDRIALALHTTWGTFWTAYGVLEFFYATGRAIRPQGAFPEMGFWFATVAAITWAITAASRDQKGMTALLSLLAVGSSIAAVAQFAGFVALRVLAGYFLIATAILAWYVASMLIMPVKPGRKPASSAYSDTSRAA